MESVQSRLMDRLSNLPDQVTETILINLPTRDAVRTSILSRKWRHVKDTLSQFVLDKTLWKNLAKQKDSSKTALAKILYQLLLGHDGPIKKFKLSYPEVGSCTEVDNLISFLCKRRIEDFSLEMYEYDYDTPGEVGYLLPFSILSSPTLRHLELNSCSIPSFASVGLSLLTTLKLTGVTISDETLARLISGSPLLGILDIQTYSEFHICIDAPNLRTLIVKGGGTASSINFKRVPVLTFVSIKLKNEDAYGDVTYADTDNGFFDCLFALETLRLSYHVVKNIGLGIPKKLPTSLVHLKDFMLSNISFSEMPELPFVLCLLRSSPNLKHIEILLDGLDGYGPDQSIVESYMEGEDFSDLCLSELREVKLADVTGTVTELEFIRLLLAKSSSLKKIQIKPGTVADKGFEILKEISTFPRISKEAQIIFG